jgi:hypothetical protein
VVQGKRTKETETPCDRVVQKFTKASKLVFGRKMFNYIEKRMVEYTLVLSASTYWV